MDFIIKDCNIKYNDIKTNKGIGVVSFENVDIIAIPKNKKVYRKYVFVNGNSKFVMSSKQNAMVMYNDQKIVFVIDVIDRNIVKYIVYDRKDFSNSIGNCKIGIFVEMFGNNAGYKWKIL